MALTVLMIIIGAINYFDDLRLSVSKQRFFEGLENATRQPNGETLQIENLQFARGDSFSQVGLSKAIGLPEQCIQFAPSGSPTFSGDNTVVTVNENILTNVYVTCDVNPTNECEIGCVISFEEMQ
ncbi:MAG TPA: hypothetical protein VJG83_00710 [archaeon]|nr:hypothetical protein [archaeon]